MPFLLEACHSQKCRHSDKEILLTIHDMKEGTTGFYESELSI